MPSACPVKLGWSKGSHSNLRHAPQSGIEFAPFTCPIRHNPVDLIMLRIARTLESTDNMSVLPKRLGNGTIFVAITTMIFVGGCADARQALVAGAQRLPELFPGTTPSEGYWHGDDVRGAARGLVRRS